MATSCSLPRLGIDPRSVVLVLGPQLTAQCLGATSPLPPFLSYRAIVEDGIQRALELEEFGSSAERQHKEQLLQSAYELEPGFAAYKVVETLRCHDQYEEWLRELFHSNNDQTLNGDNGLLNHLQSLQRQGARLVYTHYDEVLANALGMAPVTPDDEQQLRRWAEGQPALLHIHGAISKLDSLKLACVAYDPTITAAHHLIQAQFQHRTVVVIGMGDANYAPLLSKLLGAVAAPRASLPIVLTQEGEQTPCSLQSLVLPLRTDLDIHHTVNTDSISLVRSAPTTASINSLLVQLVFKDRESSGETIELLRSINYTSVQHVAGKQHNVVVELDRTDCVKLWKQVFKRASQVEGLLAVVMQDGSTVWLCDEQQQKAMIEDAPPRASSYLPTLLPLSSSSVSMVPSAWTPVLSTSTSTSAFSFRPPHSGVADSRTALPAAAQPLYQTPNHRDILRRIRSENDKLTLEDRTAAIARTLPPRKNGLFVHQKSEPQISIGHPGPQAPIPVPHPAVLMKFDGKQSEHDIEFIDRYQCNNRSAKYSKGVESAVSKLEKARQSTGKNMSFEDKKQKFISDAIKWSQNVSTQLQRLPSTSTEDTGSVIQAEGTEEQRKLLDRHFDQLQASTTLSSLPPLSNFPTFSSIPLSTSSPIIQNGTHSPQFSTPRSSSPPSPSTTSQSIVLGNCGVPILLRSSTQSTPMFVPQLPFISPYSMQTFPSQTGLQSTEPAATKPLDQTVLPSILPGGLSLLNPDQKQQLFMLSDGTLVSAASSNNHTDDNDGALHSKRVLSPNTDWSNFPLKKRRRSTSLPDVMQLANNSIKSAKSSSSSTSSVTISDHADNTSPSSPPGLPMSATSEQVFFQHYNAPVNPTAVLLPTARGLVMAKREPEEEREEDKEGGSCLLSPQDSNLHPAPTGRGPIQLWQFLLDLLLTPSNHHLIHWTGNGYEFQIQRPEDVAHLWGARKNKPRMNYDKLSRGLRYYYSKGIMDKVPGKKLTFKYTCNIEQYIVSRNNQTTPMSRSNHTTPLISSLPATVMNTT